MSSICKITKPQNSIRELEQRILQNFISDISWAQSPHRVSHVKKLLKVQRFATRLVPKLRGIDCEETLKEVNLTALTERTERDLIMTYKTLRRIDRAVRTDCIRRTRSREYR